MKVLTSAEMRAVDERTAEEFGVPLWVLMERAGEAVARFALRRYPEAARVMVLCGKGNNGGDGMVAARLLAGEGVGVRVLLLGRRDELKGEAARALEQLLEATSEEIVEELTDEARIGDYEEALSEADLLLDAVVGTGFKPPLRGVAAALRDRVRRSGVPVLAVDLPSGWDADATSQHADGSEGEQEGDAAFRADAVVTFTAPKLAHVFGHLTPGRVFGPVVVGEIGSPEEAIVSEGNLHWTGSAKAVTERARNINANKGKFGHVLLVGGSFGKAGAPSMSSLACLRAGAGLVTAAVPESILNTVALVTPELMTVPLLEGGAKGSGGREQGRGDGIVGLANLEEGRLERLMKGISVLAIGPGLSTGGEAEAFVHALVARTEAPVVIDADGLNAFAGKAGLLGEASGRAAGRAELRPVVLTPHPGEMARLLGSTVKEVEADRIGVARRFATEHGVTLVLKGWRTLVAHPDGRVAVNTTGNPGMAKGGSGDILTGIVAAMLAQYGGEDVAQAVEAAVYLHGLAADFAVHGSGVTGGRDEHTLLATDTVAHLSDAFRYRVQDEDGLVWICGMRPATGEGR